MSLFYFSSFICPAAGQSPTISPYYAALLPRRGPHIASHSVCPSVCLSVCVSVRPVIVAIGNVFSSTASVTDVLFGTHWGHPYSSARTEGRISYGHLGRTDSCCICIFICYFVLFVCSGSWLFLSSASNWLERLVSEMTYNVLMGTLSPTHSLTHSLTHITLGWQADSYVQESPFDWRKNKVLFLHVFSDCKLEESKSSDVKLFTHLHTNCRDLLPHNAQTWKQCDIWWVGGLER